MYGSKLSFTGATRAVVALYSFNAYAWYSLTAKITVAVLAWLVVMPVLYILVAAWYSVIFGVFGWFVVPFRLHRRSQRKQEATQSAMLSELRKANS